jgi:SAM-dependent methyltransferase
MNRPDLEAALYDWHNSHVLRDQQRDIPYWVRRTRRLRPLLVLGAGTGRLAVPLASVPQVVALDIELARLDRIPATPGLQRVCADMRRTPLTGSFSAILLPYSTLQALCEHAHRTRALQEAARLLASCGSLFIDVSRGFDDHPDTQPSRRLRAPCGAVGGHVVEEWQEAQREQSCLALRKTFYCAGERICQVEERWAYASTLRLASTLRECGFTVRDHRRGYGASHSLHRDIYHAVRI